MQPAKTPCSDLDARRGLLLVLEGMPGTGKTTTATRLAAEGQHVVGEYVTPSGATIPVADHPPVSDDNAHQANWLTKHRHAAAALAAGPVFCDRDWLSALAYAASLPEGDQLLRVRVSWAVEQLRRGQLAVADGYLVLHLDPATSLARRSGRLTAGHPWSHLAGLARAAAFYTNPADAVAAISPDLADALCAAAWHHLTGATGTDIRRGLHHLAGAT